MATSKDELDALIKKAGLSPRTAKKLHAANGTDGEAAPAKPEPKRSGGHGAIAPEKVSFDF